MSNSWSVAILLTTLSVFYFIFVICFLLKPNLAMAVPALVTPPNIPSPIPAIVSPMLAPAVKGAKIRPVAAKPPATTLALPAVVVAMPQSLHTFAKNLTHSITPITASVLSLPKVSMLHPRTSSIWLSRTSFQNRATDRGAALWMEMVPFNFSRIVVWNEHTSHPRRWPVCLIRQSKINRKYLLSHIVQLGTHTNCQGFDCFKFYPKYANNFKISQIVLPMKYLSNFHWPNCTSKCHHIFFRAQRVKRITSVEVVVNWYAHFSKYSTQYIA